jgi:16S rRNA A1518/A1519 N6-dimethyltransferase RsmA/KsgA/DIM1 with predicted DNA glycosylase/AP lyase activity
VAGFLSPGRRLRRNLRSDVGRVTVVEVDPERSELLRDRFADQPTVQIVEGRSRPATREA